MMLYEKNIIYQPLSTHAFFEWYFFLMGHSHIWRVQLLRRESCTNIPCGERRTADSPSKKYLDISESLIDINGYV